MPEEFLHYFGVKATREQEARRRVPEVVETKGAGETGFIEQGLEGAGDEVVTLDGVPVVERNTRSLSSHESPTKHFSLSCIAL